MVALDWDRKDFLAGGRSDADKKESVVQRQPEIVRYSKGWLKQKLFEIMKERLKATTKEEKNTIKKRVTEVMGSAFEAYCVDVRGQVVERYGIDEPSWTMGGLLQAMLVNNSRNLQRLQVACLEQAPSDPLAA